MRVNSAFDFTRRNAREVLFLLDNKRYSILEEHTSEEERAYYERIRARMLAMGYYMPPFGVEAESIVVSPKIREQIRQSLENIRDEDPSDYDEVEFGP